MLRKAAILIICLLVTGAAGLGLHTAEDLITEKFDSIAGASPGLGYGGPDYNVFLNTLAIEPSDPSYEVISIHAPGGVYVFLANLKEKGGAAIAENMGGDAKGSVPLSIPFDASDDLYTAHVKDAASFLKEKGYVPLERPFPDPLHFRSSVRAGHFDAVLLEMRPRS